MKVKILLVFFAYGLIMYAQDKQEFKFSNGTIAYWVKGTNGWGVEDALGNEIVPKVFGKLSCYGNIIYCKDRQGADDKYVCTVYDYKGNIKVPESEGINILYFKKLNGKWIGSSSWYGKGLKRRVGCVIDENGDFLYRYQQLEDAEGFKYLKNEIADTIVVAPGKYTDYFRIYGDVITTKVMSRACAMNLDGTVLIPPVLYGTIFTDGYYETKGFNVYTSENSKGFAGYHDRKGNCIIPADIFPHIYSLNNGVFCADKDGRSCILDSLGNVILSTKYNGISAQKNENGNWYYVTYQGDGKGKMSLDGKIIEEPRPSIQKKEVEKDGFKYVQIIDKDKRWGALSLTGQTIIPCEYESVFYYGETSGRFKVIPGFKLERNGYTGYADPDGHVLISCDRYNNVSNIYNENLFKVEYKGKYGLCDKNGVELIRPLYDDIKIRDKKIIANVGVMEGVLDNRGKLIIPFEYTSIRPDGDNYKVELFKKKGICNSEGKIIVPPQFTNVHRTTIGTGPYGELYSVEDGKTKGLYTIDGVMIFPSSLFKAVLINKKNPSETRFDAEWYISAWNDYEEQVCYYDLKGNLLYDSRQDKIFDKYFEQGEYEFDKKNYKKAIEFYNQAISVRKDGSAYYNIGAAFYNLRKYKDAIKNLNSCVANSRSQRVTDKAKDLIIECEQCLQQKRERRANLWLGFLGAAINVAATVVQTNNAIKNYNSNTSNTSAGSGGFKRDTSLDYLLDPRYAMHQVQQQNWNEYLQMTNGGQTMTYDEWYALKAQAWAESQKTEDGENTSNYSSSSSSNSSYSPGSTSSSNKACPQCHGSGRMEYNTNPPQFGMNNAYKVRCNECGKEVLKSWGHTHITCKICHGKGTI